MQFDASPLVDRVAVVAPAEAAVECFAQEAHSAATNAECFVMTALAPAMAAARSQVLVESDVAAAAKAADWQSAASVVDIES